MKFIAGILFSTLFVCAICPAGSHEHSMSVFSDTDDYESVLAQLPTSSTNKPDTAVLDAQFNYGLGAQFNTPVSLSTVLCDKDTGRIGLTDSISDTLRRHGYNLGTGWDKFGYLKTTRISDSSRPQEIRLSSASSEEIELDVKVDETELGERAITFGYTVITYLRPSDPSTKQDRSSDKSVERYMDTLRGEMRQAAETTLKKSCIKNTVTGITSEDSAIQQHCRKTVCTVREKWEISNRNYRSQSARDRFSVSA